MTHETRKKPANAPAKSEERDTLRKAVNALDGEDGQQPEALSQFAESARKGEESPKDMEARRQTSPKPASNTLKHKVATSILHDGANGEVPDPKEQGVDRLPDRITDRS
jgi:hypothetical protein